MQRSATRAPPAGHHTSLPVSTARRMTPRMRAAGIETPATVAASSSNASNTATEGRCPFLAALPEPPSAKMYLWDRVKEIFNPPVFQRAAMKFSGAAGMVYLPGALALPAQYMAGNPELAKRVLSEADGEFVMASMPGFEPIVDLFGKHNMLLSPEPRHSYLRSLMQPAFTPEAVAGNLPRLEAVVSSWMERWATQEGVVKGYDGLKSMTFDFILQAVFDRQWEPQAVARLSQTFATFTNGLLAWPFLDIPFTPYAAAVAARKELLKEFSAAVEEARAALAAGQPQRSMLGMLLVAQDEQGNRLTEVELLDNLLLLLVAGHDTSSSTLTLALANLQQHPEVMQRLRKEQAEVVAKHGTAITSAAIRDMVYADAVIRETLRKDNIVANTARTAAQDMDLGGTLVPAGATMQIPLIYLAEQDPRWSDEAPGSPLDPATFVPERMLSKEGAKPGSLMPFGHGPRFCLGYYLAMVEMKVFLALLARRYDFTADTNTDWSFGVGKVPKNRLPLALTPLA